MGRYLGRMRTGKLILLNKELIKKILNPFLPFFRAIRFYPQVKKATRDARQLVSLPGIRICYLTSGFPKPPANRFEITNGGAVKLTFLAESFPHSYPNASILYTVSSVYHVAKSSIVTTVKKRRLKIVLNQNGVAYPAWKQNGWEDLNNNLRAVYRQADYLVFQSKFCEVSAKKFLGEINVPNQIIYNAVDLNLYHVKNRKPASKGPIILLGGNQYEKYRFESAIDVLFHTIKLLPDARLIITGRLWGDDPINALAQANEYIKKRNLLGKILFTGSYTQNDAISIFKQADILIHTKYNDPSPNLIAEALSSGLPVVYSDSGGVPELVGPDAGIGIPVPHSWEQISLPDPDAMAQGILSIWENLACFSDAARQKAVEDFGLEKFIKKHKDIFEYILE